MYIVNNHLNNRFKILIIMENNDLLTKYLNYLNKALSYYSSDDLFII